MCTQTGRLHGICDPTARVRLADWVNALTVGPGADVPSQTSPEGVFAGCKDGIIYAVEWEEGANAEKLVVTK